MGRNDTCFPGLCYWHAEAWPILNYFNSLNRKCKDLERISTVLAIDKCETPLDFSLKPVWYGGNIKVR